MLPPGRDDTDHAFFPRFSAELVFSALKDTPVVIVTGLGFGDRGTVWGHAHTALSTREMKE